MKLWTNKLATLAAMALYALVAVGFWAPEIALPSPPPSAPTAAPRTDGGKVVRPQSPGVVATQVRDNEPLNSVSHAGATTPGLVQVAIVAAVPDLRRRGDVLLSKAFTRPRARDPPLLLS